MEALDRQLETRRPTQTPTMRQPWHKEKQEGEGAPGTYSIKRPGVERASQESLRSGFQVYCFYSLLLAVFRSVLFVFTLGPGLSSL